MAGPVQERRGNLQHRPSNHFQEPVGETAKVMMSAPVPVIRKFEFEKVFGRLVPNIATFYARLVCEQTIARANGGGPNAIITRGISKIDPPISSNEAIISVQ